MPRIQSPQDSDELTAREEQFCREYVIDFVGKYAAIRAGYTKSDAARAACMLLKRDPVKLYVEQLVEARARRTDITADRVLQELAALGFSSVKSFTRVTSGGDPYIDMSDLTPEQWAAIGEVDVHEYTEGRGDDSRDVKRVKVKNHPKLNALLKLAEHIGMGAGAGDGSLEPIDPNELYRDMLESVPQCDEPGATPADDDRDTEADDDRDTEADDDRDNNEYEFEIPV